MRVVFASADAICQELLEGDIKNDVVRFQVTTHAEQEEAVSFVHLLCVSAVKDESGEVTLLEFSIQDEELAEVEAIRDEMIRQISEVGLKGKPGKIELY